jgi:hypothetical protein
MTTAANSPATYGLYNAQLGMRYTFVPNGNEVKLHCTSLRSGRTNVANYTVEGARQVYGAVIRLEGTVTDTKRHDHDCDECLFLGSSKIAGRWYDLYAHVNEDSTRTYIGRYGIDGDYSSCSSNIHPSLYSPSVALAHSLYTDIS